MSCEYLLLPCKCLFSASAFGARVLTREDKESIDHNLRDFAKLELLLSAVLSRAQEKVHAVYDGNMAAGKFLSTL